MANDLGRRDFLRAMGLGAAMATGAGARAYGAETRPNFVVVLCDDLGYGDLGCYGHPHIQTPALDAFARQGLRLTDCYAAAPVCSPSRAGMLTGRTPHRCGVFDWIPEKSPMHLPADEVTVAALLKEAGYTTCHVGKWHCNGMFNQPEQPQPGDQGFDHWFSTQNNAKPNHHQPVNFVRNGEPVGAIDGYSSPIIAGEGIRWLNEIRDPDKPFCLFVWFHSPHEPVATAAEFMAPYAGVEPEERRMYYGNVAQTDHAFGTLMDSLRESGLEDETLVLFTSDNGPETLKRYPGAHRSYGTPGPLRAMKLHLYEGGIRVPGIVRWPGHIQAGTESATPVSGVDVLPTLCGLAGAAPPANRSLDGADVSPLFQGEAVPREKPLYWRYDRALSAPYTVAIRDGDWKLLADGDLSRFELYNLREDPKEEHELSAARPEQLARLRARLEAVHEDVAKEGARVPWPLPKPRKKKAPKLKPKMP